jgi:hypothetical protein
MNTDIIITVVVVGGVFVLLNAIFLGIIFFTQRRVNVVSQWPSTMGTVMLSTLEARSSDDGTTYYPVVHYTYQVRGQTFQGNRIAPGMEVGGTGAGKVVARYPMGAQVPVYYDPQSPSDAVLEKKAPAQWVLWLILIIFDLVLCGVVPLIVIFSN